MQCGNKYTQLDERTPLFIQNDAKKTVYAMHIAPQNRYI